MLAEDRQEARPTCIALLASAHSNRQTLDGRPILSSPLIERACLSGWKTADLSAVLREAQKTFLVTGRFSFSQDVLLSGERPNNCTKNLRLPVHSVASFGNRKERGITQIFGRPFRLVLQRLNSFYDGLGGDAEFFHHNVAGSAKAKAIQAHDDAIQAHILVPGVFDSSLYRHTAADL
jgi:hypothetical protein